MGGGGGGGGDSSRELDQTPTWAVAAVVAVIILISILLEKALHHIGEWFTRRRKKALFDALEKVKAELMILGFISLLLTFGSNYISQICISEKTADSMLPCQLRVVKNTPHTEEEHTPHTTYTLHTPQTEEHHTPQTEEHHTPHTEEHRRRLLWDAITGSLDFERRILSSEGTHAACSKGMVSLVSTNGLHQLHIFIFFLAVFHVLYSALTMALGRAKIRMWKEWEKETSLPGNEFSDDQTKFRFSHETSFVKGHSSFWTRVPILFYIVCFFRQFFRSVRKADYLTMRHGFISVHLTPGTKFNFQKYIKRSLEDDFKVVVGISPILWASVVIFLLVNVSGRQVLFWISILPLVIMLLVGTKLQAIITKMALEIQERHAVVQGIPVVQLSDRHFWFGRPQLVLSLIHFTLFQNAFQIIFFLWIWYEFGLRSCFHERFELIITRVSLGVGVQFLCSYITLPLYALVTQMGSHMKRSIFDDVTSKALKKWQLTAKKKREKTGQSRSPSPGSSPVSSPFKPRDV